MVFGSEGVETVVDLRDQGGCEEFDGGGVGQLSAVRRSGQRVDGGGDGLADPVVHGRVGYAVVGARGQAAEEFGDGGEGRQEPVRGRAVPPFAVRSLSVEEPGGPFFPAW